MYYGYNSPSLRKKTTTTYEYDSEGKIVKETVVEEEYGYSYSGYTSGTEIKIGGQVKTPEEIAKQIRYDNS